jgi:hypothetical protein
MRGDVVLDAFDQQVAQVHHLVLFVHLRLAALAHIDVGGAQRVVVQQAA